MTRVVTKLADQIETALRAEAKPERAEKEKAYLKSELEHLGASVPATRRVTRAALKDVELPHAEIVELVRALWKKPIHERRAAAVEVLEYRLKLLEPGDLGLIEQLLRESKTWALVDNLAASVAGPLLERYPKLAKEIDRWAKDPDFWIRRSALLARLVALREGRGDFEAFGRHAEAMLDEKEFFIRKAIGWVLRDVSRRRPELVAAWIEPRAARASGLTVREAIRHLPEETQRRILEAHAAGKGRAASRSRSKTAANG